MSTPAENVTPDNPALPPDVASEVVTTPLPRGAPRQGMADLIAAQRREQQAREIGATVEELTADASPPEPQPNEPQPNEPQAQPGPDDEDAPPQAAAPEPADAAVSEDDVGDMVEIAVYPTDPDGFKGMVPIAEVEAAGGTKAYAQAIAARIRASREGEIQRIRAREDELVRQEERLRRMEGQIRSQQPAPDVLSDEQRAELAAMAEEYPEEVIDTRRRVLEMEQRQAQGQVDPQAIADQTMQLIDARDRERRQAEADNWFSSNYTHIETDPMALAAATHIARELLAAEPDSDPMKVVQEVGERTDRWLREKGHATGAPPDEAAQRATRKRQLPGQPVARAVRHAPAPEPPPKTPSNVIADMKKARGQG